MHSLEIKEFYGKNFVNVEQVLPDAQLLNIHIYEFDENFQMKIVSQAKTGIFNGENWDLTDLTQTYLEKSSVKSNHLAKAEWKSLIRPELLNILLVVPEKMSAWNLYSYISHLTKNKQKTSRYEIALWAKVVYPMASLVMVLLALPFGFLQQRSGGVANKLFAGVLLGILFQVLNKVSLHLGLLNDWTAFSSAFMPTFLFFLGGVAWHERMLGSRLLLPFVCIGMFSVGFINACTGREGPGIYGIYMVVTWAASSPHTLTHAGV